MGHAIRAVRTHRCSCLQTDLKPRLLCHLDTTSHCTSPPIPLPARLAHRVWCLRVQRCRDDHSNKRSRSSPSDIAQSNAREPGRRCSPILTYGPYPRTRGGLAPLQTPPRSRSHCRRPLDLDATTHGHATRLRPDHRALFQWHPQHALFPTVHVDTVRERHCVAVRVLLRRRAPRTDSERRAGAWRRARATRVGRRWGTGTQRAGTRGRRWGVG